jgi:predicted Zn-dependent protease
MGNRFGRIFLCLLGPLALGLGGCAVMGAGMQVAGALTGQQQLADAGKSVGRAGETEEFTPEQKYYTGRTVAADLLASEKASDNTELEKYVGRVGQTLAMGSGLGDLPNGWHFILIEDSEPNAFACPGGIILVSTGLVKTCESEDELAGALAHEICHVSLDHPIKSISAANTKAALVSLAQWGVSKAAQGEQLKSLTSTFDGVVKAVGQSVGHGYDKDKEFEADKAAVQLLSETGYDPRGLKRLLLKLKITDHSHGDPKTRAEAVEQAAYELEPVPEMLAARTERFKENVK